MERRTLLAASAAATTTVLAGCNGLEGVSQESDDGGETPTNQTEDRDGGESDGEPEESSPDPRSLGVGGVLDWLHEPGLHGGEDAGYEVRVSSPATVDAANESLSEEALNALRSLVVQSSEGFAADEAASVDFWNVETHVAAGPVSVLTGEFDRGDVLRALSYDGLERVEAYEGYTLLSNEQRGAAIAVEGEAPVDADDAPDRIGTIVVAVDPRREGAGVDVVRTAIDVSNGDGRRYAGTRPAVETALSELGVGVYGTVEGFEPVQPDEAPSNPTPYTDAPIGGETASELTADTQVEFDGQEYQFIERYGLGARAGDVVTVSATTDRDVQLGVVVSEGDGARQLDGNIGASGAEVEVEIPTDGGYNFLVYNPDRLQGGEGSVEYTVSVQIEGTNAGGPEAGVFEGEVSRGSMTTFTGDTAVRQWALVFDGSTPVPADLDAWIESDPRFDPFDDVEYSVLRQSVVVEGSRPVESLDPSLL